MGAARRGSTIGRYDVCPAVVAEKKAIPPEIRGVSWAAMARTIENIAKVKTISVVGLADLERRRWSRGRSIATNVAMRVV
jgi:hypothetical protein